MRACACARVCACYNVGIRPFTPLAKTRQQPHLPLTPLTDRAARMDALSNSRSNVPSLSRPMPVLRLVLFFRHFLQDRPAGQAEAHALVAMLKPLSHVCSILVCR